MRRPPYREAIGMKVIKSGGRGQVRSHGGGGGCRGELTKGEEKESRRRGIEGELGRKGQAEGGGGGKVEDKRGRGGMEIK